MNANGFESIFFVTAGCIALILILSLFVSVRSRSFQAGVRLFLLFTLPIGLISVFLIFYSLYLPEQAQYISIASLLLILIVAILIQGFLWWWNARRGGKILHQKDDRAIGIVHYVILILFVPVFSVLYWMYPTNQLGIVVFVLWGIASIVFVYRSVFEIREKGFVIQGKFIPFTDVEHAEWQNLLDKTKLSLRLKNKDKVVTIKTPWEMNVQIDNYLRANFPRS